jgi:hypothetical protein
MAGGSKSLASFFGDDEEMEMKSGMKNEKEGTEGCCATDLISLLFKARNDAHISHLLQKDKTLARHNAFGIFYESILDQIDTFCESYMGLYPVTDLKVPASSVITEPVSYFTNLYAKVQETKEEVTEGYLQNQCDSISELIAQTLYRFKNIVT